MRAIWLACITAAATVPDHLMTECCPIGFRNDFDKVLLNFDRVGMFRELKPPRQSAYMGIHDNAFANVKSIPENNIGSLAANAR